VYDLLITVDIAPNDLFCIEDFFVLHCIAWIIFTAFLI